MLPSCSVFDNPLSIPLLSMLNLQASDSPPSFSESRKSQISLYSFEPRRILSISSDVWLRDIFFTNSHASVLVMRQDDCSALDLSNSTRHQSIANVVFKAFSCNPPSPFQIVADRAVESLLCDNFTFPATNGEATGRLYLPMQKGTGRWLVSPQLRIAEPSIRTDVSGVFGHLLQFEFSFAMVERR